MRHLIFSFAALFFLSVAHPETLCRPGELDYFSCKTSDHGKIASVCGNVENGEFNDDSWIQYRFGKTEAIELTYPDQKRGSVEKFDGNHFNKYGVIDLRFMNQGALYSFALYNTYSGDDDARARSRPSGDVNVYRRSRKAITIECMHVNALKYYPTYSELNDALRSHNGAIDLLSDFQRQPSK